MLLRLFFCASKCDFGHAGSLHYLKQLSVIAFSASLPNMGCGYSLVPKPVASWRIPTSSSSISVSAPNAATSCRPIRFRHMHMERLHPPRPLLCQDSLGRPRLARARDLLCKDGTPSKPRQLLRPRVRSLRLCQRSLPKGRSVSATDVASAHICARACAETSAARSLGGNFVSLIFFPGC